MSRPVVIGVAGGTGSGKTTVAREIYRSLEDQSILILEQDSYYKDQSSVSLEDRAKTNYDHPFAIDNDLLLLHLDHLLKHESIQKPVYDFTQHTRSNETCIVEPKNVIILEGILILEDERLRSLMDIKLYVDTASDVRIIRRMMRDMLERGRSFDSIVNQYMSVVRPMHEQFVEPTKKYADLIIPEGGENQVAIDLMVTKINTILRNHELVN